jgi:hypothetical protein
MGNSGTEASEDDLEFIQHPEVTDEINSIRKSINLKKYQPTQIDPSIRRKNILIDIAKSEYVEPTRAISILEGFVTEPNAARILGSYLDQIGDFSGARRFYEIAEANGDIQAKILLLTLLKKEPSISDLQIRIVRELNDLANTHHPLYEAVVASQELDAGNLEGALVHCVHAIAFADPKIERASLIVFSVILDCFNRLNQELVKAQKDEHDAAWLLGDTYSRLHVLLMEISDQNDSATPWHFTELLQRLAQLLKQEFLLGNFSSAGMLSIFSEFYAQTMSIYFPKDVAIERGLFYNQDDGSLVFETYPMGGFGVITPEEIAIAILNGCEKGDFLAFNFGSEYFEAYDLPKGLFKKYEDEYEEWSLAQYLED